MIRTLDEHVLARPTHSHAHTYTHNSTHSTSGRSFEPLVGGLFVHRVERRSDGSDTVCKKANFGNHLSRHFFSCILTRHLQDSNSEFVKCVTGSSDKCPMLHTMRVERRRPRGVPGAPRDINHRLTRLESKPNCQPGWQTARVRVHRERRQPVAVL